MILRVKVKPSSKKELVRRLNKDTLEVKVSAPPEKGKANRRVLELIAEHFGIKKSSVRIVKGKTSREKLVEIDV